MQIINKFTNSNLKFTEMTNIQTIVPSWEQFIACETNEG